MSTTNAELHQMVPFNIPAPGGHPRPSRRGPLLGDHHIRSLVLYVDLVGSRRIWPAHVGRVVDLVGSRRVPSDPLDDQAGGDVPTLIPLPRAGAGRSQVAGWAASQSSWAPKGAVKRRRRWSARRDTGTARRSGRLGAPRLGSRAGEAAAPHGRWSARAVRCSTGQRAGHGGGRPPTRPPGRAEPGRSRGYGRRRGRTPSGCGHLGRGVGTARPGVRPARME